MSVSDSAVKPRISLARRVMMKYLAPRPLKRVIQDLVEDPISEGLLKDLRIWGHYQGRLEKRPDCYKPVQEANRCQKRKYDCFVGRWLNKSEQ